MPEGGFLCDGAFVVGAWLPGTRDDVARMMRAMDALAHCSPHDKTYLAAMNFVHRNRRSSIGQAGPQLPRGDICVAPAANVY